MRWSPDTFALLLHGGGGGGGQGVQTGTGSAGGEHGGGGGHCIPGILDKQGSRGEPPKLGQLALHSEGTVSHDILGNIGQSFLHFPNDS